MDIAKKKKKQFRVVERTINNFGSAVLLLTLTQTLTAWFLDSRPFW